MKIHLAVLMVINLCIACGETNQPPRPSASSASIHYDDAPFVKDTAMINYIDSVSLMTNKSMFHKPKHYNLDVSHLNQPNLKIGYYTDPESSITRILISENEYRTLNLKYFYYKNDLPFLMHYRYWDKNLNPQFTEETYIYFDDEGKMFYAGERQAELAKGEIPAKLKTIDLSVPPESKKELFDFVMQYWNLSKPLVDQNMALEAAKDQAK